MDISTASLEKKIGQLLLMGFHGNSPDDPRVQKTLAQAENGEIGGVALFRYNIDNREQTRELTAAFREAKTEHPLFIGLDQEGGKVQRLNSENGFSDTRSAKEVASSMSTAEAEAHYSELGAMLNDSHFNFDWAPCVDVDDDPGCPVIGGINRSYSSSPEEVVQYAQAMINGLNENGIISCIKHFPGHGRACGDTHEGLVDITETWSEVELEPYRLLLEKQDVNAIMSAHLLHRKIDPALPATLSPAWLGKLRSEFSYEGVIISDCLHMGAMLKQFTLKEVVIKGLNAGLDILLFSNNPLAAKSAGVRYSSDLDEAQFGDWKVPDADLPARVRQAALEAIDTGELSEKVIDRAFERVLRLKERIK